MNKEHRISLLTAFLSCAVLLWFNFSTFPQNILSWDVFGYYLYLPLTFIYDDLGLKDVAVIHEIIDKYDSTATFYQATRLPSGNWVMKYSMGMALLYLPFFLLGHAAALLSDYPADGFSLPYQYVIFLGGVSYTLAGIFLLRKLLLKFFNDRITALVLIVLVLGTNYLFHTSFSGQNAMSHNYLFTLYVIIVLLTIKWHHTNRLKHLLMLGMVCGVTVLARPSEIVCLFIPLLWGVTNKATAIDKLNLLKTYKRQVALFLAIFFSFGLLQVIYWQYFTGHFIYDSYGDNPGEGFELLRPYVLEVLFSFRKGWLIYTPVMLLSIMGMVALYRKNKPIFYAITIYFLANLYIVSSWSCWWYAQSFSQRALIPSYVLLAIPLGYFLLYVHSKNRLFQSIIISVIVLLVGLNLFQIWQLTHGIIDTSRMTKDYYLSVFGSTSVTDADKSLLLISRSFDGQEQLNNEHDYRNSILEIIDFESLTNEEEAPPPFSGKRSFRLDPNRPFSPAIEAPYSTITTCYYAWIRASVMIYPVAEFEHDASNFVVAFEHNNKLYKYRAFDLKQANLKPNQWNQVSFDYLTPEVRNPADKLKVYVWHRGNDPLFIDDLKVEVFEPLPSRCHP